MLARCEFGDDVALVNDEGMPGVSEYRVTAGR